ncbi:M23 family metallopeptidase [Pseudemcibacter aquimaris]|uniref:M23 family metallopeptidase n=1 Tax=Pseudemcibacter aquimaris TaxID=2857064 RepID=UPI002011CF2F|nr:M23 family metallopeptidase [Pseudemcibacter aquimaris]
MGRNFKINSFIKDLNDNINRYFPDRQLYFRANGDVRFVTVSKNVQLMIVSALICFSIWCAFISYKYIYLDEILTAKNGEVAEANRNYAKIEAQFTELQQEIQKTAAALEQRQAYIQQVMEEDGETLIPAESFDDSSILPAGEFVDVDENNDQEARNNRRDNTIEQLFIDLKKIEMAQNQQVAKLSNSMDNKLAFLSDTLTKAGISQDKMMELANVPQSAIGTGGPFIEASEIIETDLNNTSFDTLFQKRANHQDLILALEHLPILTPPEKHYVSSNFGMRRDPFTKKWANHRGLDMAAWRGTPINAPGAGVVTMAGRNGAFGLFIEIDHGNGFKTKYGHLSKLQVKRGDKVDAGQLIGNMGSTGRSTSTHLHYEIWFNGEAIDPLKVLKAAKDVQKIKEHKYDA